MRPERAVPDALRFGIMRCWPNGGCFHDEALEDLDVCDTATVTVESGASAAAVIDTEEER